MKKLPRAPLEFQSVFELLTRNAQKYPSKEAIISYDVDNGEEETISHSQLLNIVQKTCSYIAKQDIRKGDRYAILMHNTPEVLIMELAGALLGAATVPLDYKRDMLERKIFKLKETGAKILFIKGEKSEEEKEIVKQIPHLKIVRWRSYKEFETIIGGGNFAEVGQTLLRTSQTRLSHSMASAQTGGRAQRASLPAKFPYVQDLSATYIVLYTSGTTAHPKGAILSQRACLLNASGIAKWQQFSDKDRFLVVLPLHHINSTIFSLSMILVGGTIILCSRYSGSKFWETVHRFGATNTSMVPTILHDLLMGYDNFRKKNIDISSLKKICIGSAPVLPDETYRFYTSYGIRVTQGYGQTETALRVAGVPVDLREDRYIEAIKTNTIGKELANNNLAIMDLHNNHKKEGEEGEICISGPVLSDGYLNDSIATEKSFKNGWFHSGDLGKYSIINGEKYFYIIGRIREIIIKGGVNISPSAIEDVLLRDFSQVDEIAVVGYQDERMGEEIAAVMVLKKEYLEKKETVHQSIIDRLKKGLEDLSSYETPQKVFFLPELPKTSTGKIQRVIVKKLVNEMIKLSESAEVAKPFSAPPKSENGRAQKSLLPADSNKRKKDPSYIIRQIKPTEKKNLEKAAEIESSRFGLPTTYDKFRQRAGNGVVLGAFNDKDNLIGTISCLRLNLKDVEKLKTWNEATGDGTLRNNNPKGDTLLCVAISVEKIGKSAEVAKPFSAPPKSENGRAQKSLLPADNTIKTLSRQYIDEYVSNNFDHVLNFHKKPKGGIDGAKVWKILPDGRPEDKEAVGYNVLMKYPDISPKIKIEFTPDASPSILLLETALYFAYKQGIKHVIAFSRPSGFRKYLLDKVPQVS